MEEESLKLTHSKSEFNTHNYVEWENVPKYPQQWIGKRYFRVWRQQAGIRRDRRYLLTLNRLEEILGDAETTVRRFAVDATMAGLFVRQSPGKYVILPPNRAFVSLAMKSHYHAQILQLTTALHLLKEPHVFICYGANYYSQLWTSQVHVGLSLDSQTMPEVGGTKVYTWKLDPAFFENSKEIRGPRQSYRRIPIPSVENEILLLAYTRLPRFEMIMDDILMRREVNWAHLMGAAPVLKLTKRLESRLQEHKRMDLSDLELVFTSREIQLPKRLQEEQHMWLLNQ